VLLLPIFFAYTGAQDADQPAEPSGALDPHAAGDRGRVRGEIRRVHHRRHVVRDSNGAKSAAIGILMNTRGLMELVILNIGRELGVITDAVFAMMVIMALVTTALTTPILALGLSRSGSLVPGLGPVGGGTPSACSSVLIPFPIPASGAPLAESLRQISPGP
jgi:hypothetical protein